MPSALKFQSSSIPYAIVASAGILVNFRAKTCSIKRFGILDAQSAQSHSHSRSCAWGSIWHRRDDLNATVAGDLWAIDGAGLVMATALLTIKYFRTGNDVVAGGFLVFAIGEGVLLSSAAPDPESSIPSFAAGITLWGTALLLVSIPRLFALPVRIIGIVSAILFILTAARIFMGEQLLPTSTPLPADAYPFLVATFIGWIWMLWRSEKLDGAQT